MFISTVPDILTLDQGKGEAGFGLEEYKYLVATQWLKPNQILMKQWLTLDFFFDSLVVHKSVV